MIFSIDEIKSTRSHFYTQHLLPELLLDGKALRYDLNLRKVYSLHKKIVDSTFQNITDDKKVALKK
ncbi:MAG: hypothetical protein HRT88_12360 [Lentisphaeraceae bacterium]|nr:hypothetical protein [Lentisphaeraceae bacterium]